MDLAQLLRLAARNHGVVHRDDAIRAGISRSAWYRANDAGVLVAVHPCVSRVAGYAVTPQQRIAAAVLAGGLTAIASHRSASFLWGAEVVGDDPVDVIVGRRRQLNLAGATLHRPVDLVDLRPVRRSSIPTTNPLRTVVDVGAVSDPVQVAQVVESFLVQRRFGLSTLRATMERHATRGRAGVGALRLLLDEWVLGETPPDSVLETAMGRLLVDHGLPAAVFHHRVATRDRTFELDFAFVENRVDVEVDGWAYHGSRSAFEADRARDALLTELGWRVLRFSWFRVQRQPAWVAERIGRTLGR